MLSWCVSIVPNSCTVSYRCALKRIATSFIWMWSISHLRSCLSVSVTSSSLYTPGMTTDRLGGPTEICRNNLKQIWFKWWHFADALILFTGRPRLCVKRVSEEVQASCWCDRRWCHLQSVSWWRAYNHCTSVISRHRAHYSYFLWRRNTKTENVEQILMLPILFHY